MIKKTGKSLTGSTIKKFHTELYLNLPLIWWYRYKSLEHQIKLTAYLLIFNQVHSLLNIFERLLVSNFNFKPPVK